MRKFSFCGIFATLFVTTTIILLASCSQDDDSYESDMYTLAEMETRSGGGDPGGGQPSPVITNVDSITEFHEMYFFPNEIFNSSEFQHSPYTAIDPSLYGGLYVEVDMWVTIKKVNNVLTIQSYSCSPSVPSLEHITDTIPGFHYNPEYDPGFMVTDVYLQSDGSAIPGRFLLYATGIYTTYNGEDLYCTAFIPNHIYM